MKLSYKLPSKKFNIYNLNRVTISLGHIRNDLMINWHEFYIILLLFFYDFLFFVVVIKYIFMIILNIIA